MSGIGMCPAEGHDRAGDDISGLEIPEELISAVRSGECLPFIGSGISRPSGTPTWTELVDIVRSRLGSLRGKPITADELDLLQVPLSYRGHFASTRPLHDILRVAFGEGYAPNAYHRALVELPIRTYLTTNWDRLIELALTEADFGSNPQVLHSDSDVSFWNEHNSRSVIKLHGTIERQESIVFSEDDYYDRYSGDSLLFQLARVLFASRSVMMLGFSLSDTFVKLLFRQVRIVTQKSSRPHWYIIPSAYASEGFVDYVRQAGFTPLVVPPGRDPALPLLDFLIVLARESRTVARDRHARAELLLRETAALEHYHGPDRTVRVRAILGPLGNPRPGKEPFFGSPDQDLIEYELHELCLRLADSRGFKLRLIGSPHSVEYLEAKGYDARETQRRLSEFLASARAMGERFEFAPLESPTDRNQWISADRSVVDSWKGTTGDFQLYPDATLTLDRHAVQLATKWYDDDFEKGVARAGGIAAAREQMFNDVEHAIRRIGIEADVES